MPQWHSSQPSMARAGDGTRVTSRVFTLLLHAGRWPHLTARTPVMSLHYPDRVVFTNTKERKKERVPLGLKGCNSPRRFYAYRFIISQTFGIYFINCIYFI